MTIIALRKPARSENGHCSYRRYFLVTMLVILVSGCASGSIEDLVLVKLEAVQRSQYPEYKLLDNTAEPDEFFLKATILSAIDLSRIKDAETVGEITFFCDRPKENNHLGGNLFWNGKPLPLGFDLSTGNIKFIEKTKQPFEYYTLIRIKDSASVYSKPPLAPFDLKERPEDVCLQIEIGSYRALGYKSNVVVIPAKTITDILKAVPADASPLSELNQ